MASSLPVIQPADLVACCSPVTGGVVADETAELLARMFKALGDPTRVKLLSLIAASPDGEACVCDLTAPVGLSQPTVSHHMRLLVEAGLASREQRGRWAYYRVAPDVLRSLAAALAPAGG
ncbi:metalloregulator ArsR/SmtB family transcription factor [Nocardioides sp. L-11A]|uniref:ArsR/SmtB family transcription factor n=1 Tax=Nocardioides sp. L-11A TaxID=3043848 RepID=UPI00249BE3A3|nr:metalloregulator ArsR/SmtB family transcription factor [Nocardioides sp. L-11A]